MQGVALAQSFAEPHGHTVNLFPSCTCASTHNSIWPHHKTFSKCKVSPMWWALCKFRGPGSRAGLPVWWLRHTGGQERIGALTEALGGVPELRVLAAGPPG